MQSMGQTALSRHKEDRPLLQELEALLESEVFIDAEEGYMKGSMSGESWKAFLSTIRDEMLQKLNDYRMEGIGDGFCASALGPFREEKLKIERAYLRHLMGLYRSAEKAYRIQAG